MVQKSVQLCVFLETFNSKNTVNFSNGSYSLVEFRTVARDDTCLSVSSVHNAPQGFSILLQELCSFLLRLLWLWFMNQREELAFVPVIT